MGVCQLTICEVITLSTVLSICNVGIPVGSLPRFKVHKHQGLQTHNQFDLADCSFVVCQGNFCCCTQRIVFIRNKNIS